MALRGCLRTDDKNTIVAMELNDVSEQMTKITKVAKALRGCLRQDDKISKQKWRQADVSD